MTLNALSDPEGGYPIRLEDEVAAGLARRHGDLHGAISQAIRERFPDSYVEEIRLTRGSITLAVAFVVFVGYGSARQSLDYVVRDISRILQRFAGSAVGVTASGAGLGPPSSDPAADSGRGIGASGGLLAYLVFSHFILVLAVLVAGGFLLANAI